MAVYSGSMEIQEFSMRDDEEPKTKVYGRPLTERQRQTIMKTSRRGDFNIDEGKLFALGLAPTDKGVFISNIYFDGSIHETVKDKDLAVEMLMSCRDVTFMNELKTWLIGMSELDEGEAKNFKSRSKPSQ